MCANKFDYITMTRACLSEDREAQEIQETKRERTFFRVLTWKDSDSNAKVHIVLKYLLTYYKATVRANHVSCSVVLYQNGFWVVGTLNSGKGQSISAKGAEAVK